MSITQDEYAQQFGYAFLPDGGVTSAKGFKAAGIHAGFRKSAERLDMALVVADQPCATAAAFTQNVFCAAPVQFSKAQLERSSGSPSYGTMRAIVINSGNANAATGDQGLEDCRHEASMAADVLGCPESEVLVASTGVIGVPLPMEPFETGLPAAASKLANSGGHDAANAILTTDTRAKECAVSFDGTPFGYDGIAFTVGGMAKGSGMIMPNVATMIAILTTDAPVEEASLFKALTSAVGISFNKVTVDSDTSTNDTCIIFASGAAAVGDEGDAQAFTEGTEAFQAFEAAVRQVCVTLARAMAADGEGATKLVDVTVTGAKSDEDADLAARTVANSPLVKTAIAGHDANWGRIAAALGRSGASFSQEDVDIDIMGIPVCRKGLTIPFDEDDALARFESPEIAIDVNLNAGDCAATLWTCDMTHDYISINADYRT